MKGSFPIHKYIHDVYKISLSQHTIHTQHTQSICVWYRRIKAPPNFGGAFAFVDDIEITGVILFILYVLSWHAIREATEDFIRNSGGEGCNFKGRDAFMTLRTQ